MCIDSSGGALEAWLLVSVTGQNPKFILVQNVRFETCFFSYRSKTGPFGSINETIWRKIHPRAAKCILARHFPVAPRTQPQVPCLAHPGQMLFNAVSQQLLVRNTYLPLSLALSVNLETLTTSGKYFNISFF